jgi:hypothetical protein
MEIITLVVVLVVVGLLLWAIETAIPLDPQIKTIIRVVIIVAVCLWLLSIVGLLPLHSVRIGRE